MVGEQGYYCYWGKCRDDAVAVSFHRLVYHCLDVAAVGRRLAEARPRWIETCSKMVGVAPEQLVSALAFLLVLHDLGKFGRGFQRLRPDLVAKLGREDANIANKPRHDTLGYWLWRGLADEDESSTFGADWSAEDALLRVELGTEPIGALRRRELLSPWLAAVMGHHGRPPEVGEFSLRNHFGVGRGAGPWQDVVGFLRTMRAMLKPPSLQVIGRGLDGAKAGFKTSSWWMAGFTVLCDWIGSNRDWFEFEPGIVPLEEYWERALARATNAVTKAGLEVCPIRPFVGFDKLFLRDDGPLDPSPLQQKAAEMPLGDGPQLFLLEDLTGSGKTEAALTLVARLLDAGRGDGLYFALPTMATANAMHGRVGEVLPKLFGTEPSYMLAHSGPNLHGAAIGIAGDKLERQPITDELDDETASRTARSWLLDHRKKALLADAGVGTIDQALVGIIRAKHNSLRLLGLHGHVLVVDEVHACDEYMNGLLEELLRVHASMGGSAVLLSATLSLGVRQRLIDAFRQGLGVQGAELVDAAYPCLAHVDRELPRFAEVKPRKEVARTVAIEFLHSLDKTLDWCVEVADKGRCVAWIRNTVREALEAYDALVKRLGQEKVILFHARFPMGDRLEIEQAVVERFGQKSRQEKREGQIVIATQVMEQSLDVDFDDMVSDLAPIDRLIQRCGRMQRHARGDRGAPTLRVLAPEWAVSPTKGWPGEGFSGTMRVYPRPSALWRTQWALRHERRLELPVRARWLVEAVFGAEEMEVPPTLLESDRELKAESDRMMQGAMARYNHISFEAGYRREGAKWADDERAPTRLGEPTTVIRLVRQVEGRLEPWSANESEKPEVRWRLGEASVRASQLSTGAEDEQKVREALEALDAQVPSHVVPVVMARHDERWKGAGRVSGNEPVIVVFQPGRGLSFVRDAEE